MFVILVVVYKRRIEDSETLQSLLNTRNELSDSLIIVWDNSPVAMIDESGISTLQLFAKYEYRHTHENYSLSQIYNIVSQKYLGNYDYLVLFDHDSDLDATYFSTLRKSIRSNKNINLFLPVIYSDGKIVSPANNFIVKSQLWNRELLGLINSRYKTAINSGMTISKKVFEDGFMYDERLTFYGTDNYFMKKFSEKYDFFCVIDCKIKHDLSFNSSIDMNSKLAIFRETKRANRIIYEKSFCNTLLIIINNFLVSIKLAIRFKNLSFLK
jgi:GT2 family glycosyltransferase